MEVFFSITKRFIGNCPVFRYHSRCRNLGISHLIFADNLLLFSYGDLASVSTLKRAIDHFKALSGLSINCSKSQLFLSGVDSSHIAGFENLLGFDCGTLPIKYLGVPLISTRLKNSDCRGLVERITRRINHWSSNFLSYAGRVQLIQSVLFSMVNYWSSIFVLPKSVLVEVNQLMKNFLWTGTDDKHSGAKVAWFKVCQPKECGALGFRNLETANLASSLRHIWTLLSGRRDNLWAGLCESHRQVLVIGRGFSILGAWQEPCFVGGWVMGKRPTSGRIFGWMGVLYP
ncbi:uncharacterized protein LOC132309363 [Cornus florida]|uniref:uncharacterized protein LOC132309363 n=1 Tax=Cornus florida TaxID=4283 RepID=UPI0028A16FBB|nr:uncharacterized protein LOC132309363 [Cornus florida]